MKKWIKWILIALVLVGLIIGATVLYNALSEEYGMENLMENAEGETDSENEFSAPDFTVFDYEGNKVKLSDFKGKPVVLNFWATWCYYCKVEMPDFETAYKNHPEVQFVMVNATDGVQETVEIAKEYIEKEGYEFDVFFDENLDAVNAYRVTGFPSTFFIDKDGNLVAKGNGMLNLATLEKGIGMISESHTHTEG